MIAGTAQTSGPCPGQQVVVSDKTGAGALNPSTGDTQTAAPSRHLHQTERRQKTLQIVCISILDIHCYCKPQVTRCCQLSTTFTSTSVSQHQSPNTSACLTPSSLGRPHSHVHAHECMYTHIHAMPKLHPQHASTHHQTCPCHACADTILAAELPGQLQPPCPGTMKPA